MQINSNLQSLAARHSLTRSTQDVEQSVQRLSGGQRINGARDDGAGLAISERMTAGINGLNRAGKNINDGIALLQVADGAAGVIADNFQRIRELTVQAANGSNSGTDRDAIQQEVNALVASNYDIAEHTRYNSLNLLDGSFASQLQVGAGAGQTIALSIAPVLAPRGYGQALVDVAPQQATAVGTTVSGALVAGALLINGTAIGPSAAGSRPGQGSDSAFAVAAAINDAGVRDVAATASNSVESQVAVGGAMAAGDLVINGIDIGPIAGGTAAARAASAAAAIAAVAGSSGVSASASGATLSLSTADGRNIEVAERGGGNAGSLGLTLGVHAGSISVSNTPATRSNNLVIGGGNPALAGLHSGVERAVTVGPSVSELREVRNAGEPAIDLGSFSGATDALDYIDAKIDSISTLRGQLGATSNRLEAAYRDSQGSASNLAAARARIRDADYASEAAQLTRSQILRQAGTSMLAQANALPQLAMQLLR